MSTIVLEAQSRDVNGTKPRHLRRDGLVPVIVYGKKQSPVALTVTARNLELMLRAGGNSQLVELQVEGGDKHNVLIRDLQREPVNRALIHADFQVVQMDEKQHVSVQLVGTGKPATLVTGLMVLQSHETINIEALPADIPSSIEVDLTYLSEENPIKLANLPKVAGVTYLVDEEAVLFALTATQAGLTEEELAEEQTQPVVIGEEEAEEGEEATDGE